MSEHRKIERMPHTPGPWKYRPQEYDDWGWVRATAADGENWLVAMARSGDYTTEEQLDEHRRNKTDPYEANARLIAAAPELLEVAIELLDWVGRANDRLDCDCLECNAVRKGRAIIAKATGKSAPAADCPT